MGFIRRWAILGTYRVINSYQYDSCDYSLMEPISYKVCYSLSYICYIIAVSYILLCINSILYFTKKKTQTFYGETSFGITRRRWKWNLQLIIVLDCITVEYYVFHQVRLVNLRCRRWEVKSHTILKWYANNNCCDTEILLFKCSYSRETSRLLIIYVFGFDS